MNPQCRETDPLERMAGRVRRNGPEVVVFIHGLGASRDAFDPAFEAPGLRSYTLAALDLPGFGESPPADDASCAMKEMARLVIRWLDPLDAERVHIVGHSMGGVVGLHAAELLGPRAGVLLSLEGNLGIDDCGFSGKIASLPLDDFERHGFSVFRGMLRNFLEKDPSPGLERYARDLDRADPAALHRCARSLVRESSEGRLRERFLGLPLHKAYFGGEKSLPPRNRAFLARHGIPCHVVEGSGHFMMEDRPDLFWPLLAKALRPGGPTQEPAHASGRLRR